MDTNHGHRDIGDLRGVLRVVLCRVWLLAGFGFECVDCLFLYVVDSEPSWKGPTCDRLLVRLGHPTGQPTF